MVYDSHDLFADAGSTAARSAPVRRVVRWLERRWAGQADAVITVNEGLRAALTERLGRRDVAVVYNCPPRYDPPEPRPRRFHERLGLPADAAVVLYHGGFSAERGIEQLVAAMGRAELADVHAVCLGYGVLRGWLAEQAADPALGGRLHVLDAVPPGELLEWVASADLGIVTIQPTTLNHRLSTPNKLWECLAAGTPVVASDFPQLRAIVADAPEGPLGLVCDPADPAAIGHAVAQLLSAPAADRAALRARCLAAAHARWNWEGQAEVLLGVYARLSGTGA